MVTLAVPAAAAALPLVASLRRSNGVQLQDGGRVTSVMVVLPAASNFNLSLASLHNGTGIHQHRWPVVVLHISPSLTTPPRWLQVRGSRQYEKLQNRRNSEAWNQIQSQSSTAQHPHCSTLGSRSQQRVISSSCSSWLGSSSVIPSSFRGFNSTRTHLWKRPIFVPAGQRRRGGGGRGLVQFKPAPLPEMLQTFPPEAVMVGLTISCSILGAMICASGASAMGIVDATYFSSSGMAFLADLDPDTAKLAIGILGPLFASFNLLFIVRIVMSWYPQLPVGKFPFVIAYAPTEPVLGPTRRLIPPVGGVDVSPVIWLAVLSFVSEILLGQQGLLVLLSQQQP
ncbi:unnamed protein product [Sphagnum jensenii]|uniref:Uncharacterized protein n=1 Tax=Sphagnum jensenii TaxID=128206 RepID=A0ABP0VV26_9BRYO